VAAHDYGCSHLIARGAEHIGGDDLAEDGRIEIQADFAVQESMRRCQVNLDLGLTSGRNGGARNSGDEGRLREFRGWTDCGQYPDYRAR
jgi:hypothetical protein